LVLTDGETLADPEVTFPVEKPLPVQEVAFDEDHERMALPPDTMPVGDTESVAIGAGGGGVDASVLSVAEEHPESAG
jgi:hypothetical protein